MQWKGPKKEKERQGNWVICPLSIIRALSLKRLASNDAREENERKWMKYQSQLSPPFVSDSPFLFSLSLLDKCTVSMKVSHEKKRGMIGRSGWWERGVWQQEEWTVQLVKVNSCERYLRYFVIKMEIEGKIADGWRIPAERALFTERKDKLIRMTLIGQLRIYECLW